METIVKISNFLVGNTADFKGLDAAKNIDSLQLYSNDFFHRNVAIVVTTMEEVPQNEDLEVITQKDYDDFKSSITMASQLDLESLQKENADLKIKQELMQEALDELIFGGSF